MSDTVRVRGEVRCPRCDLPLLGSARFQWGAVPGWECDLGSESVWMRDKHDRPYLPFILAWYNEQLQMWNCGDPRFRHVILLDEDVYYLRQELACSRCESISVAVACTVTDGFYREMYAMEEAELDALLGPSRDKAQCIIVREDGSYWPREDWFEDRPLEVLEEIPAEREVTISLSEIPWLTLPKNPPPGGWLED